MYIYFDNEKNYFMEGDVKKKEIILINKFYGKRC